MKSSEKLWGMGRARERAGNPSGWRNPAGKGEHDRRTNRPGRQCNTGTDLYRVPAPAAVGRIAVVRTLLCPARDCGRDGRVFRCNGAARGVHIVTWAISRNPLRPGALVTAGDVCHLHPDRAAAERCGALMGGAPDLVRLEKHTARVYRVLWSLWDVAGGELRKPAPPPAPPPEKRPGAVRSWPGNVRISGPVAARAAWERLTGGDP